MEDEDERHRTVGETAVDEAGLAAPALRIPLADHVDAGRVHHAGAHAAEHAESDEGEGDVRRERQRQVAEQRAARPQHHRPPRGKPAALTQPPGRKRHRRLAEHPGGHHPVDAAAGPVVGLVQRVLGGRERVLGGGDAHHADPGQDHHPLALAPHDVDVGLAHAVDAPVPVGHLPVAGDPCDIGGCHVDCTPSVESSGQRPLSNAFRARAGPRGRPTRTRRPAPRRLTS